MPVIDLFADAPAGEPMLGAYLLAGLRSSGEVPR